MLRRPALLIAALATALGGLLTPTYAANPATPGDFTGYGFDQCNAPTQAAMDAWLKHSPFWAVGIYISGASRACREQPNLTPSWVATQQRKGWRLLPITLGPQASCATRFPRYGNDPTIDPRRGKTGRYPNARRMGRAEAESAVAAATALGIAPGSTLWYDLEGYDNTKRDCRESALAFLSGWTTKTKALGYVSGVYSSAGSGIKALDDARRAGRTDLALPQRIWIARWDGIANTSTSYIAEDGWRPGGRMKQYRGGHNETWGGVTINIDSNWLDLGLGSVAPAESHCGSVAVDFSSYVQLAAGTTRKDQVRALKCLLTEQGYFSGRINGAFGPWLVKKINLWQAANNETVQPVWTTAAWMKLHAAGKRPVLKTGSAGPDVRRLQRALNSMGASLTVTGVFNAATTTAVKRWQSRVGHAQTGVVYAKLWTKLQRGKR